MKRTIAALGVAVLTTVGISQATSAADYGYDGINTNCSYEYFDSWDEMYAYWIGDGGSASRNVDGLDDDGDGVPCEWGLDGSPPDNGGDDGEDPGEDPGDDDSGGDDDDDSGDDDSSGDDGDNGGSGSGDPDRVQTPGDSSDDGGDEESGNDGSGGDDSDSDDSGDGGGNGSGDESGSNQSGSSDSVTTLPSTGSGVTTDAAGNPSLVLLAGLAAATLVVAASLVSRRA